MIDILAELPARATTATEDISGDVAVTLLFSGATLVLVIVAFWFLKRRR